MRLLIPLCLGSCLWVPAPAPAQGLSPVEARIVRAVDSLTPAAVALLERTVNINSGTFHPAGVRRVGEVFQAELDALGFATRLIPMDAVQRGPHLLAERTGQGPRILLIGHLDTVFEEDSPFQDFERLDARTARGPGTEDMKGGNVVAILALQALRAAGVLDGVSAIVAFTGDEEDTGDPLTLSRRDLVEAARRSRYALGFEGGVGGTGTATVARRGFTGWTLWVRATTGHSSLVFRPEFGYGALFELARILDGFRTELAGEEYLTFNPGVALGGATVEFDPLGGRGATSGKTNIIAETALAVGDLRTVSIAQRERTKERMRAIVARHLPGTMAELEFEDSSPPMDPKPANYELLAKLNRVSLDLGFDPIEAVDPARRGAADISFVAADVTAALDGLGVVGDGGHTVQEVVDLTTIPFMAKRAALLIYRLSREAERP